MILVQVNVLGIEGYKDKIQLVPHFSLGCSDKKRAEYLFMICSLETKANSRAPSTKMTAHQIKDQRSVPPFEDFNTETQDWLSCVLGPINLRTHAISHKFKSRFLCSQQGS